MAVLLQWNIATDTAASTEADGVIGSVLTNASLSNFTLGSAGYAADPVLIANPPDDDTNTVAEAVANDSYWFFSIAPDAGKTISLTSLTFNVARGGASTPRGYAVRSSVDEFATNLATADVATQRTTFTPVTVDLSGASFQNLSSAVTFNIYVYAPVSGNSLDFDDITINGSVSDGGTVEQEGFRWRSDDGSQTTATWLAAQDTNIIKQTGQNARLRVLLNSTLNRGTEAYRLEYRQVGTSTWLVIEP